MQDPTHAELMDTNVSINHEVVLTTTDARNLDRLIRTAFGGLVKVTTVQTIDPSKTRVTIIANTEEGTRAFNKNLDAGVLTAWRPLLKYHPHKKK